ncbi:MAG: hypothetical protein KGJ82_14365 [Nitrospirota bacterium]|nr:hypothetical protein [Nitrospirota bacterium]
MGLMNDAIASRLKLPAMIKTRQELIEDPSDLRPHIVLLGAGASRSAFPNGDAVGRPLPLMDDLVNIVGLQPILEKTGLEDAQEKNFELIYEQLTSEPTYAHKVKEIERCIDSYFSALSLPNEATLYDRLLVSLRPKDAVFTFNWDPFLFDAYQRNRSAVSLPEIFFLHGNVRIGACLEHDKWGARKDRCPQCLQQLADVPLLYPIGQKDYSTNPYIQRNWHAAEILFRDAFTLTIFGYGAPASDVDAMELLRSAWTGRSDRKREHIEIIDIADQSFLYHHWSPFAPTHHYLFTRTFEQSRLARWPRRSCESLMYPMTEGVPCEDFPLPTTDSLAALQAFAAEIAGHENRPV